MTEPNCTFHSFKKSGKWYATGRGHISDGIYYVWGHADRRRAILMLNDGKYPGLSGDGQEFVWVVLPDDDVPHGHPLMLFPPLEI